MMATSAKEQISTEGVFSDVFANQLASTLCYWCRNQAYRRFTERKFLLLCHFLQRWQGWRRRIKSARSIICPRRSEDSVVCSISFRHQSGTPWFSPFVWYSWILLTPTTVLLFQPTSCNTKSIMFCSRLIRRSVDSSLCPFYHGRTRRRTIFTQPSTRLFRGGHYVATGVFSCRITLGTCGLTLTHDLVLDTLVFLLFSFAELWKLRWTVALSLQTMNNSTAVHGTGSLLLLQSAKSALSACEACQSWLANSWNTVAKLQCIVKPTCSCRMSSVNMNDIL